MTNSEPGSPSRKRVASDSERVAMVTRNGAVAVAVITAISGICVTLIGVYAANRSGAITVGEPTPSVSVSYIVTPGPTVTVTKGGGSGSTTPGASASGLEPDVRNSSPIVLRAGGSGVDLESDQRDWSGSGIELGFTSRSELQFYGATYFIAEQASFPSYDACATAGGYGSETLQLRNLSIGEILCFRSSVENYGMLKVTNLTSKEIAFDAISWEK